MKTIQARIMVIILGFVIFLSTIFGAMSCILNYRTASTLLETSMTETATVAADQISAEIRSIQNVAIQSGCTARLANPDIPVAEKKTLIDQTAKRYGFQRGNLLDASGTSAFDGNNYADRSYFQRAMQGEAFISDPTISKVTGKVTFLISAPLWAGGIPDSTIVGVVYYAPDENFLNDIVSNINVSDSGYGYIINQFGTVVADIDPALVGVENTIDAANADPALADLAAIETKMIAGETSFGKHLYEGVKWVEGYAPIPGTDGWSVGIMAHESDFLSGFYLSLIITLAVVAGALVLGTFSAVSLGKKIGSPLKQISARLESLANGDLHSPVPVVTAKDETGALAASMGVLSTKLSMVVDEVSHQLTEMADGNFALPDLRPYSQDFLPLSTATNQIVASLNNVLSQINEASSQVSVGADQVSSGAQALSQGATEQASSIEELSASITEISDHVRKNAENAQNANTISGNAGQLLVGGNEEMSRMLTAMGDIEESSKKISNIIKTINDIAFQTNILALNAAVEAARAGEAGKGFAVVADEVRNLAGKSAEAAKSTTDLISNSSKAVENGTQLAHKTADILVDVMGGAKQSTDLVSLIAGASGEQAQAIGQITLGVEQISAVVQTNSATAEESAAASEELSGQAQLLRDLVAKFRLKQ